ncbi:MAG: oxygenase MpaB family protein [Acidimicrobiia bacterium]
MTMTINPFELIRTAAADSTAGLFAHDAYPLAQSLKYQGDPGLFGPGSPTWLISGDVATFVGGIRALLIQAAHPEVVAGVADHSVFEEDPLGRLSRTSSYVTATAFGAMPEVEEAISRVRRAHVPVKGASHRGINYTASGSGFASWVHNVLTDSFLVANQHYGRMTLEEESADAYVAEQTTLGGKLHAGDLPVTASGLAHWIEAHPDIAPSPGMERTVAFLKSPPLPAGISAGYRILFQAAVATIPERIRGMLGVSSLPLAEATGRQTVNALRWTMGSSPSWWIALERVDADFPEGVRFRRPPPADDVLPRWETYLKGSH